MSTTLDYVRTSDSFSKPAFGIHGQTLGCRLYTMKFAEMYDSRDYEGKQNRRMEKRAIRQAKRLPEDVVKLTYNWRDQVDEYEFQDGRAIFAVSGEKIRPGDCVFQMRTLWIADQALGQPRNPHVGYVAEVRRGVGAVIDFRTDNPISIVQEDEWGALGHVLTYENRYTKEREYRFRFCNGEMYGRVERDPLVVARAAEEAYAKGYYEAYNDPKYIAEQEMEALAG